MEPILSHLHYPLSSSARRGSLRLLPPVSRCSSTSTTSPRGSRRERRKDGARRPARTTSGSLQPRIHCSGERLLLVIHTTQRFLQSFLFVWGPFRFVSKRRLLIISAPSEDDYSFQQQLSALSGQECHLGQCHSTRLYKPTRLAYFDA